jgi:hypothetical protein
MAEPARAVRLGGPEGQTHAVDLRPERVTEARFMMASPGREAASLFGHSMLHLVVDGPEHPERHLVVSYRGHVDDLEMSHLKGIFGGYVLQPFFFLLPKSVREYTGDQDRTLTSYPLRLAASDRDRLVETLLDDFRHYRRPYSFVARNCASELQARLYAGLARQPGARRRSLRPAGVLADLRRSGLIGEDVLVFPSLRRKARCALAERVPGADERWFAALPADFRLGAYERALAAGRAAGRDEASQLAAIEESIRIPLEKRIQAERRRIAARLRIAEPERAGAYSALHELLQQQFRDEPAPELLARQWKLVHERIDGRGELPGLLAAREGAVRNLAWLAERGGRWP